MLLVLVLGPVGFAVWLIARGRGRGRAALVEAAGDVTPTAVAFAVFLVLALSIPAVTSSELWQLALILGLPLALGWLGFQGPLLARAARRGYVRTLWQRLPHTLIAANLGLAGIHTLTTPLINVSIRACPVFPEPGWTVGVLWASVVAGALLGGLLLFLYGLWAVKRGLSAWCVVGTGSGEVRTGTWRVLWPWVLLSYLAVVGGVAASAVLQQLVAG
jgi:hypothetical protein